jgi:hypothetical protein
MIKEENDQVMMRRKKANRGSRDGLSRLERMGSESSYDEPCPT